jgi:hypothetical protein
VVRYHCWNSGWSISGMVNSCLQLRCVILPGNSKGPGRTPCYWDTRECLSSLQESCSRLERLQCRLGGRLSLRSAAINPRLSLGFESRHHHAQLPLQQWFKSLDSLLGLYFPKNISFSPFSVVPIISALFSPCLALLSIK